MSVVIVEGSEDFFCEEEITRVQARNQGKNVIRVDAKDSPEDLYPALESGGLFASSNLVVVLNASKADSKWLSKYCESPNPNHTLVLVDKPGKKAKWYVDLKRDESIQCASLKSWEYKDWVVKYCHAKGYNIDNGLAEALHANVGDDLYALSNEIEKITLKMGDRHTITPNDVTSVLVSHQVISPVKIVSAWTAKQVDVSLRYLTLFFHQSTDAYAGLGAVAMFLGNIERMITFLSYTKSGFTKRDICDIMSISPYVYEQLQRDVSMWNLRQLRDAYVGMCEVEAKAKKGGPVINLLNCFLAKKYDSA